MTSVVLRRDQEARGERVRGLTSAGGGLHVWTMVFTGRPYVDPPKKNFGDFYQEGMHGDLFGQPHLRFAGFAYQRERPHGYVSGQPRLWRIPWWFVAALLAAPSALAVGLPRIWRWRAIHGRRRALCVRCGYDLWATPDRCPECGAVPPGHSAA